MICKLSSVEVTLTNLALNNNLWAIPLNMLEQLSSCHMLELLLVANITTKLWTLIHGMLLQVVHGLPNDNILTILPALMWELTEINTVS